MHPLAFLQSLTLTVHLHIEDFSFTLILSCMDRIKIRVDS